MPNLNSKNWEIPTENGEWIPVTKMEYIIYCLLDAKQRGQVVILNGIQHPCSSGSQCITQEDLDNARTEIGDF